MILYNNGYIVKELIENENFVNSIYRGIEYYKNWPLESQTDPISKELTELAENSFEKPLEEHGHYDEFLTF